MVAERQADPGTPGAPGLSRVSGGVTRGASLRRAMRSLRVTAPSPACLYILRLTSGSLYIGVTRSLRQRLVGHEGGVGCATTGENPSVGLIYTEDYATVTAALKRERQLKRWTRAKKEALVAGDVQSLKRLSRRRRS